MSETSADGEAPVVRAHEPEGEHALPPHAGLGVAALTVSLLGVLAVCYIKAMAPLVRWQTEAGGATTGMAFAAEVGDLYAAYAGWLLLVGGVLGIAGLFQRHRRRVFAAIAIVPAVPVIIKSGDALMGRPFYIVVLYAAAAIVPLAITVRLLNARAAQEPRREPH